MFGKILIANRGEIAVRIIRACRELGISTVAVYSAADSDTRGAQLADETVNVGPADARHSYLNVPNIIQAALKTGADAIHPGYGFLSEDPYFARICADNDITFIGPTPDVMSTVGDKSVARRLMSDAGLPLLPGTVSPVASAREAHSIADDIGYPVIVKAAAGGGGRGITVVHDPADLETAYETTRANARLLFKNGDVYIEKFVESARHVEIQVMCDEHGAAVHLGERDCSVQRRHQKLIEEAPSPNVDSALREALGDASLRGAKAVGYQGAGTMEFLVGDDGDFWFMEMNARIQVEHPVTELVTGIDLIAEQIRVAAGESLSVSQADVDIRGHAIECRINAEDPDRGFAPAPGRLDEYVPPDGPWTRVDSHCVPGSVVVPFYDSMIAKLITWAPDRPSGLARMQRALGEFRIDGKGLRTTIPFHERVLADPLFRSGEVTTNFLRDQLGM